MVVELSRDEFLHKIQIIDLPMGEWLAVCLVITESLHNLNIPDSAVDEIIELGKQAFSGFQEGFFARIGRISYIACIKDKKEIAIILIDKNLSDVAKQNKHYDLWKYNVTKVDGIPLDKIMELEWKTNKGIKYEE